MDTVCPRVTQGGVTEKAAVGFEPTIADLQSAALVHLAMPPTLASSCVTRICDAARLKVSQFASLAGSYVTTYIGFTQTCQDFRCVGRVLRAEANSDTLGIGNRSVATAKAKRMS